MKKNNPIPNENTLVELSDFFKLMSDKTRIQILWHLDNNDMCVNEIANSLNMTKSAVSHQLKSLKIAKLVKSKKNGKNVFYSLNDNHVKVIFEKALEHILE